MFKNPNPEDARSNPVGKPLPERTRERLLDAAGPGGIAGEEALPVRPHLPPADSRRGAAGVVRKTDGAGNRRAVGCPRQGHRRGASAAPRIRLGPPAGETPRGV